MAYEEVCDKLEHANSAFSPLINDATWLSPRGPK